MSQNYAEAPCILGSVVHISNNSLLCVPSYSRKLKMLRAELFSLLSCCHSIKIVNSYNKIMQIKRGVLAYAKRR